MELGVCSTGSTAIASSEGTTEGDRRTSEAGRDPDGDAIRVDRHG